MGLGLKRQGVKFHDSGVQVSKFNYVRRVFGCLKSVCTVCAQSGADTKIHSGADDAAATAAVPLLLLLLARPHAAFE